MAEQAVPPRHQKVEDHETENKKKVSDDAQMAQLNEELEALLSDVDTEAAAERMARKNKRHAESILRRHQRGIYDSLDEKVRDKFMQLDVYQDQANVYRDSLKDWDNMASKLDEKIDRMVSGWGKLRVIFLRVALGKDILSPVEDKLERALEAKKWFKAKLEEIEKQYDALLREVESSY